MKEIINIDLMVEKVKHKIKTECPFIFEKCSDEKQNEIIETFYRIVLDEIEINKIRHELDINTLNTVINIIKTLLPSQETFNSNAIK